MMSKVLTSMYDETKEEVKKIIRNVRYLGLCTATWTSATNASYITITAHVLDDNFQLHSYVLDTTEIIETHISEHLLQHIEKVFQTYEIYDNTQENVTVTFNCTNYDDIHEQDQEAQSEINYLHDEDQDTEVLLEFNSSDTKQTQMDVIPGETETPVRRKNLCFFK